MNPMYFFTIAHIGVDTAHSNYFPFSEYIITIGVILISLYSYNKTNNLYFTFLITYYNIQPILILQGYVTDTLAIIMVGISYDKKLNSVDLNLN
jgi:hypothetical protein